MNGEGGGGDKGRGWGDDEGDVNVKGGFYLYVWVDSGGLEQTKQLMRHKKKKKLTLAIYPHFPQHLTHSQSLFSTSSTVRDSD